MCAFDDKSTQLGIMLWYTLRIFLAIGALQISSWLLQNFEIIKTKFCGNQELICNAPIAKTCP
jgi:hypothetical protein